MKNGVKLTLTAVETFFYVLACIVTLAGLWLTKVVIKKAIYEAVNEAIRDGLISGDQSS